MGGVWAYPRGLLKTMIYLSSERKEETNMELLEQILTPENLNKAYKKVCQNKGSAGIDGVTVDMVAEQIKEDNGRILNKIRKRTYKPLPVKRVQIPKENGKKRKDDHSGYRVLRSGGSP